MYPLKFIEPFLQEATISWFTFPVTFLFPTSSQGGGAQAKEEGEQVNGLKSVAVKQRTTGAVG